MLETHVLSVCYHNYIITFLYHFYSLFCQNYQYCQTSIYNDLLNHFIHTNFYIKIVCFFKIIRTTHTCLVVLYTCTVYSLAKLKRSLIVKVLLCSAPGYTGDDSKEANVYFESIYFGTLVTSHIGTATRTSWMAY